MTFKEFLIYKNIPFKPIDSTWLYIDYKLILPYEEEFKAKVPYWGIWLDYWKDKDSKDESKIKKPEINQALKYLEWD